MSARLRDADAQAVDLLLDRAAAAQGNGDAQQVLFASAGITPTHAGVSNERIAVVERMLKLLDLMPVSEPGADLLRQTLDRIGAHTGAHTRGQPPIVIDHGRPVA